ncbi:unnamed protein product [Cercopithifilaria johnstoni]|uniref:RRM domain-containing protein n=1 Tax=Cercopithifilaria johnstoni TaxID=2874296 RepID=A0A8J2MHN4_9BILA|nr:unnamed protein product [Cercopithifilaria johnstoni]
MEQQNQSNRSKRTLYLSNINLCTSVDDIYETFCQAGLVEKVTLHENADGTPQYAIVVFKEANSLIHVMSDYNRFQLGFDIIHCSSNITCPKSKPTELSRPRHTPRQIGYEKKRAQQSRRYATRVFENSNYKNDTIRASATTTSPEIPSPQDGWNPFKSPLKSIISCNFLKSSTIS